MTDKHSTHSDLYLPTMPRDLRTLIFVGIKNAVVAVDAHTGDEVWRAKLTGMASFVTVLWDGEFLVASADGEVFGLDWRDGTITWHNKMKGLGLGFVSLASSRAPTATSSPALAAAALHSEQQSAEG
jgi:outer membrane protein assembly factor BamB